MSYINTNEYANRESDFSGCQGRCYILNDEEILKLYYRSRPLNSDLTKFKSDCITFPYRYIPDGDKIAGEVMPYIKKNDANKEINLLSNINNLLKQYYEIVSELTKFGNIDMIDLCCVNILYSKQNGFSLIDTTSWELINKNVLLTNLRRFSRALKWIIFDLIEIEKVIKNNNILLKHGNEEHELYKEINSNYYGEGYIDDLLLAYSCAYKKYMGKDIVNILDIKKYNKKLNMY